MTRLTIKSKIIRKSWRLGVAAALCLVAGPLCVFGADAVKAPDARALPPATRPVVRHPAAEAAKAFAAALKAGDVDGARRMIAASPKPLADQPRRLARLVANFQADAEAFAVYDVRAEGDIGVLVVGHALRPGVKTFDSDAWFVIRQSGEWRMLPNHHEYDLSEYGFDDARIEAYRKLEEWAGERAREMKKQVTGCDC